MKENYVRPVQDYEIEEALRYFYEDCKTKGLDECTRNFFHNLQCIKCYNDHESLKESNQQ